MQQGFFEQHKIQEVCNATEGVAGTDDINTDTVDTAGYDGVAWIVKFGAITAGAVTSVKVQQGAASNMSDAADLEGTAITVADDDDGQLALTEVIKPTERYVRLVVDRGTQNAVVENVTAILFKGSVLPVTQDSTTVISTETHLSPAEGTA